VTDKEGFETDDPGVMDPQSTLRAMDILTRSLGWRMLEGSLRLYISQDITALMDRTTDERATQFLRGRISAMEAVLGAPSQVVAQANARLDNARESHASRAKIRVDRNL